MAFESTADTVNDAQVHDATTGEDIDVVDCTPSTSTSADPAEITATLATEARKSRNEEWMFMKIAEMAAENKHDQRRLKWLTKATLRLCKDIENIMGEIKDGREDALERDLERDMAMFWMKCAIVGVFFIALFAMVVASYPYRLISY